MITLRRRLLTMMAMTTMAFAAPGEPEAAVEGELGGSSQGRVRLALVLNQSMNASGFDDLDLGDDGLTPGLGSASGCILSSSGGYTVTALGRQDNAFEAVDDSGNAARYRVRWSDAEGTHSELAPGALSSRFSALTNDASRCRKNGNARLEVALEDPTHADGRYADVLTLIVAPQ